MPRYKTTRTTAKRRIESYPKKYPKNWKKFFDPYPEVKGTYPEKLVYLRLIQMQIPFMFQSYFTVNIPEINLIKDYRPDFIIPSAKIIIEVQGSYWHSKPAQIESDSYKYALYQTMGYQVLIWWDYEIETNLDALIANSPINRWTGERGGRIIDPERQADIDDLKGLRTLNTKYKRKPYRTFVGSSRRKVRKANSSYGTR